MDTFFDCAEDGNVDKVRARLRAAGRDVWELLASRDESFRRFTALHYAAQSDKIEVVRVLLEAAREVGPEKTDRRFELLEITDEEQTTALHTATRTGHDEVVKVMLKAVEKIGHDEEDMRFQLLKKKDDNEYTALHYAVANAVAMVMNVDDFTVVKLMLDVVKREQGQAYESPLDSMSLYNPLDVITYHRGQSETKSTMVKLFFDAGADLNATAVLINEWSESTTALDDAWSAALRAALRAAGVHIPSMARWVDRRLRSPMNRLIAAVGQVMANGREHRPKRAKGEAQPPFQPKAESGCTNLRVAIVARTYLDRLRGFPRFERPDVLQPAMDLLDEELQACDPPLRILRYASTGAAHRAPLRL